MADDTKKYLVKIGDECGASIGDINKVLQSCNEIRPFDGDKKSNVYNKYKSEQEVVITLLNNTKEVRNIIDEIKDSNIIVYTGNVVDDTHIEGYSHIEITKSIKWREDNKTVNKDEKTFDFLKYIIQILSDICNVGLMQGYEANNREKVGKKTDKREDNEEESKDEVTKLQRNKYIICDYGDADTGKSNTLREVIKLLNRSIHITYRNITNLSDGDEYAQFTVNSNVKVSVCTQGDPRSDHPKKLVESINAGMDVIVCAARDDRNGAMNEKTVNQVYEPENTTLPQGSAQYIKIWYRNFFIAQGDPGRGNRALEDIMCSTSAKGIVELIEHLMGVRIL